MTAIEPALHGRAGLNGQAIQAEMRRAQSQNGAQTALPARQGLVGHAIDQVQVEVVEADGVRLRHCLYHSGEIMFTA